MGELLAVRHVTEIAEQVRAKHPDDPLDGLWIIGLGITLVGALLALFVAVVAGIILYLRLKSSAISRFRNPGHYGLGRTR